jgi:hypothetical protein
MLLKCDYLIGNGLIDILFLYVQGIIWYSEPAFSRQYQDLTFSLGICLF